MSLIAKETGTTIEPIPEGVYTAVCYSVVDIGTQYSEKFDKANHKVVVSWELPELRIQLERDGKQVNLPRAISKRYTLSLGDKAILRKDLEAWRGRTFVEQELRGFDLKKLLNTACHLQVIHNKADNRTYANVGALMALPKGVKAPKPENDVLFFSFEDADDTPDIPSHMPEWMVNLIKESREWEKLTRKQAMAAERPQAQKQALAAVPAGAGEADDDDVAF